MKIDQFLTPSSFDPAAGDPTLDLIVDRITSALKVDYIFNYSFRNPQRQQIQHLFIILRSGQGQGILESKALCDWILEGKPQYWCTVAFLSDLEKRNRPFNLRALLICQPAHLVYRSPEATAVLPNLKPDHPEALERAHTYYDRETARIQAFEEGFRYYLRTDRLSEAGFMLHQTLELGFRAAEILLIGKEKITHSLKNHQLYLYPFNSDLGLLFSTPDELMVLAKLDEAYKAARYEHHFQLNVVELIMGSSKADKLLVYLSYAQEMLIREIQRVFQGTPDDIGHASTIQPRF